MRLPPSLHIRFREALFMLEQSLQSKFTKHLTLGHPLLQSSDEELVSRARAGSTEAFDILVSRYQERVYALACRVIGNEEDACDVQQETFVRAWMSLGRFKQQAAFPTWLYRIVVNVCLSRKRRRTYLNCPLHLYADTLASRDASVEASVESAAVVRDVLASIPAHYRILLVLREVEGKSIQEIAEIVGGSVGGIRTRLHRARKLFRAGMRPYLSEEEE